MERATITIINKQRMINVDAASCLGRPTDKPAVYVRFKQGERGSMSFFVSLTPREASELCKALVDKIKETQDDFLEYRKKNRERG